MKLRHAAASPFVRKVMVCAHELGLAGRIELVPTAVTPIRANSELAPENPLMKVPSLVTDDGEALFDSPVICEYLDSLAGGNRLFPASGPARWAVLRQQALGDGILEALILCRYELVRPDERRWAGWTDGQMTKARQGLAAAERENLAGPRTIGPITIGCMLGYLDFRFPDEGWRARHPKLAAWYAAVEQLPSMRATKPPAG
ncbi:MAG TPA: glutathione S-transferase [Stellaceae bacterium]|jgi:glutathione S-transferase